MGWTRLISRIAVIVQERFFDLHVHDFADELRVQADLDGVQQPALDDHREFLGIGGIDEIGLGRREFAGGELVDRPAGNQPAVVGFGKLPSPRHGDRERLPLDDIGVGGGRLAERNRQTGGLRAADAAPGDGHQVRLAFRIVVPTTQVGVG